jgi:hypothetical protein
VTGADFSGMVALTFLAFPFVLLGLIAWDSGRGKLADGARPDSRDRRDADQPGDSLGTRSRATDSPSLGWVVALTALLPRQEVRACRDELEDHLSCVARDGGSRRALRRERNSLGASILKTLPRAWVMHVVRRPLGRKQ